MAKVKGLTPIPGYEGLYAISESGDVWSNKSHKYLKPGIDKDGYRMVTLYRDTKPKRMRIHRLVLLTYKGEAPEGRPLGLHRDGDVTNNRVSNLRWGDNSENMRDRVTHGTCVNSNVTHCPRGHEYAPGNTTRNKTSGSRTCLKCRSEDKARQRERGLAPDDPRHGTSNGWFNWNCRCTPCCDAAEVYRLERKEKLSG